MSVYVALLRGINVGGKNIIKMSELKQAMEEIGLQNVQTYIQSGNILFQTKEEEPILQRDIEQMIELKFGMTISVILRTSEELKAITQNCPFTESEIKEAEASSGAESLYVALLHQIPLNEKVEKLNTYQNDQERYKIINREIYLLFNQSIRNSKLANQLQKLDMPITVRNWKTIMKLAGMANAMDKES